MRGRWAKPGRDLFRPQTAQSTLKLIGMICREGNCWHSGLERKREGRTGTQGEGLLRWGRGPSGGIQGRLVGVRTGW